MAIEYLEWADKAFAFDRKAFKLFLMVGDKMEELSPKTFSSFTKVCSSGDPITREEALEWAEEFAERRVAR
ncbi:hypothetical protein [Solidesulfovibrio magneticus]|uniref:Uncharacterized protein n=1 Tax=Solidesulfovibrio magneticus (strain ATCC 700980 / DSM 13731 / RS-1) TaxID=573370 RepID=C4XJ39_SOLM1|nr:hypothetical protein [Solidesulfovibrio magneticus]BAH74203.1 hypothetical protein DMR_07120 [Solidesulfovibrio magneticus RS-1]